VTKIDRRVRSRVTKDLPCWCKLDEATIKITERGCILQLTSFLMTL